MLPRSRFFILTTFSTRSHWKLVFLFTCEATFIQHIFLSSSFLLNKHHPPLEITVTLSGKDEAVVLLHHIRLRKPHTGLSLLRRQQLWYLRRPSSACSLCSRQMPHCRRIPAVVQDKHQNRRQNNLSTPSPQRTQMPPSTQTKSVAITGGTW